MGGGDREREAGGEREGGGARPGRQAGRGPSPRARKFDDFEDDIPF